VDAAVHNPLTTVVVPAGPFTPDAPVHSRPGLVAESSTFRPRATDTSHLHADPSIHSVHSPYY
jgi:hypothetical protein